MIWSDQTEDVLKWQMSPPINVECGHRTSNSTSGKVWVKTKKCILIFFTFGHHLTSPPRPSWTEFSFLVWTMTKTTSGSYSRSRRLRKMHLENILLRASWDRDPRYPMEGPMGPIFFLKNFLSKSYLGICRQVWGVILVKKWFLAQKWVCKAIIAEALTKWQLLA